MTKRCILIGAGEFVENKIDVNDLDFVIAADGGYHHCLKLGIVPHLVVSDFDSYSGGIEDVEVKQCRPEKDDTDMLLAIHEGLKRGYKHFVIYGGMGGRLEHTFANIQCMKYLSEKNVECWMISKDCKLSVLGNQSVEFDEEMEGYISLFSLSDESIVSIENLKYPLNHAVLTTSYPLGIDNEFIGKKSKIDVHKGYVLMILNKE